MAGQDLQDCLIQLAHSWWHHQLIELEHWWWYHQLIQLEHSWWHHQLIQLAHWWRRPYRMRIHMRHRGYMAKIHTQWSISRTLHQRSNGH
jgi:hypothetical protein